MPKVTTTRTFTACWTCRRRNVRCDTARPSCSPCKRSRFECEGYDIRLVWVDQSTGAYVPQQRRAYACDETWRGYPGWTPKEVDHLINECGRRKCQCALHRVTSPFTTFRQSITESKDDFDECTRSDRSEEQSSICATQVEVKFSESSSCFEHSASSRDDWLRMPDTEHNFELGVAPSTDLANVIGIGTVHPIEVERRGVSETSTWSINFVHEPSLLPDQTNNENRLFHHYTVFLSIQMVPIDFENNPWKSTYPSIAIQEALASDGGTRPLYHAILALTGLHLANLKGPDGGKNDLMIATRYYALALNDVREHLNQPTGHSYNTILAAMIVITLMEHNLENTGRGWRTHLIGALQLVMHDVVQKSWFQGHDAWVMTQTLAMFAIIAETTNAHSRTSAGFLAELGLVLRDVMGHPRFGYTVGGNARLLNAIYQVRQLEEQLAVANAVNDVWAQVAMRQQAEDIMQELQIDASDHDVDTYLSGNSALSDADKSPQKRSQVKMHLDLFAASIMIYCHRNVLHSQPCAVAGYVHKVLSCAHSLMEADCGAAFIWPVFVAAVEAYTPEMQDLASRFLMELEKRGGTSRKAMQQVIRQVWMDRQDLTSHLGCEPGEVAIDWRKVMGNLEVDILLL